MKKSLLVFTIFLLFSSIFAQSETVQSQDVSDSTFILKPDASQKKSDSSIVTLLSRYHYSKMDLK